MYELIPDALKSVPNWVCWRADPNPKSHSGISKKPINPRTGRLAKSNDPTTWSDFATAVQAAPDFAGIGFMFENSGFFGVDLDDMPDEIRRYFSGDKSGIIGEFVDGLQSYAELSQSKQGIHIICKGKLPEGGRRRGKIEMYDSGRFFVMTGNCGFAYPDVVDCTESVKPLHAKYLGKTQAQTPAFSGTLQAPQDTNLSAADIIEKAQNSQNGQKFAALYAGDFSGYPSQSEADMAFCSMLAFWCGGDLELMDEIYRSSGLMRDKWDRKQSGSTYGKLTLQRAAEGCTEYYKPSANGGYMLHFSEKKQAVPLKKYKFDDTGNAQRLMDNFGEILRYNYTDKKWMYYDSGKWSYDNIGYHRTIADAAVGIMERERQLYEADEEQKKAFSRHITKTRSFSGKTNMLRESEHYNPLLPSMLDKDKMLLGCKNGIVDLQSGQLLPHDKHAYMTKQAVTAYHPDAPEPKLWLQFLHDIFNNDEYLIQYVQKCVGYSLTGSTAEQCAFFMYGTGCNGKSTFLEVIRGILGDYATNIQPQTIMISNKSGNAPTSDIARLKGARLVTTVEPNAGNRLDEGLVKQLTGDDTVTARRMFADEFEFKPEFKLWMATNHKPVIRGTDVGIWRRIHLIPFEIQIPDSKKDVHLKYKLFKELDSIFKWAVEGCRLWQAEGLQKPKAVEDAVSEYKREMDVLSAFLDDCCTIGSGEVKASQLYAVYAKWADENHEYKMSSTKFGREIIRRGIAERVHKMDGWYYQNMSLLITVDYSAG